MTGPQQSDTREEQRWKWTPAQLRILRLLEHGDWRTSHELADELGARSKASLTKLLRTLADRGLLEVEQVEPGWYGERRYRFIGWVAFRERGRS